MILSSNDKFKNLTSAQKIYVLSALVNKIFEKPENYGLNRDGVLRIGDKLNFTSLFENQKEIESIFEKAESSIVKGSSQETTILENHNKIEQWVKNNPDSQITSERIAEILAFKSGPKPEPVEIAMNNEPEVVVKAEEPESILREGGRGEIEREIEAAKARLAELEGEEEKPKVEPAPTAQFVNPEKAASLRNGLRSMMSDANHQNGVEAAFREEINSIYGSSGFLGMGKMAGIDSPEWKEMARLPAHQVVAYYTGDSTQSGLPPEILEKLTKSKKHGALMSQVTGLMEQAGGAVKAFDNEDMEKFIKRLGAYVLKNYSNPNNR